MSLWDAYLDYIGRPLAKGVNALGKGALFVGKSAVGGVEFLGGLAGMAASPSKAVGDIVIPAGIDIGTTKPLSELNISEKARQGIKDNLKYAVKEQAMSNDLVLKAGVAFHDNILSPYISRPIATAALVTDINSPLYQSEEYEKGFQLNDIRRAYNRSEKVSLGQALTKSDLTPIKSLAYAVLPTGGINLEEIDLWNDQDVQDAFVDNTVGRWFTGIVDFTVTNIALAKGAGAIASAGKLAARKVGLSTRGKAAASMETDIDDGVKFAQGLGGRPTNIGDDVIRIANTKNESEIVDIFSKYSNNENLVGPLARATNPETVRDLLLADKGYLPSLDRLSKNAPADLFEIADVKSQLTAQATKSTRPVEYTEQAWDRMNAAFDDAINRTPEYRTIRDALIDPENKTPWVYGKDYAPMEPIIGSKTYRTIRGKIKAVKTGKTVKDVNEIGGIESVIVGNPKVATRIIRFVGKEMPMGYVTFSGSRPFDSIRELTATFDDIDLLRDPNKLLTISPDGKTITAGEYRSEALSSVLSAKNPIERKAALEKIDNEIGFIMAYTNGFFDKAAIENMLEHMRGSINNITVGLGQKGYAMDHTGTRIIVDNPLTQRQLIESFRFSPWREIEQEIKVRTQKSTKGFVKTSEEIKSLYETFNKWWTFEVLARPSYIPKQSLAEPMLSATIAHGAKFVIDAAPSMTKNFIKNNKNRVMQVASRMYKGKELKAIDESVTDITRSLDQANGILDDLIAQEQMFMDGSISPKAKAENYERVKKDIRAAERLVEDLEIQLMDATKPFGQMADVPTISNLERRLDYLDKNVTGPARAKIAAQMANAKSAIANARGTINTLVPDSKDLFEVNKKVAQQFAIIDDIIKDLGEAQYERAVLWNRSAKYKERYYGKGYGSRFINGQWVRIESLFDENQFGAAFREEFANSRTASQTYLGDLHEGIRQGLVMRRSPQTVTRSNDPMYFEELTYLVNRSFRGDPLVDQVLAGSTFDEVLQWGLSDAGKSYFSQFGTVTDSQIPMMVRDQFANVYRYLPNQEARTLASKGDVKSTELQMALAKDFAKLHPIQPLDFNYVGLPEPIKKRASFGYFDEMLSKGAARVFGALTRPENPIRWASADIFFFDAIAKKANDLALQGLDVVKLDTVNTLRSAARREALQMNEKTFYTINRNNRILYAARLASAFPTATLNAFYRYGRFAINNPQRVASFLYNYQAAFRSFGIDQYGNQVDDPLKATHLIVPGTKEMGFFGGQGIRLNARSIGFLLNFPTPSFYVAQGTSALISDKPDLEDALKNAMGPTYDIAFPYGLSDSFAKGLVPVWANDLYKYAVGPESDKDFLSSWNSVHNFYMTQQELGISKYPGPEKVKAMTQYLYAQKFRWTFASLFGVPAKVDVRPMQIFDDYYGILVNKYITRGASEEDAKTLAEQEFLKNIGTNFPLDRVTFKGRESRAYIQPTSESFNRIFVDNIKLVESLSDLDPEVVGLMTMDIDYNKDDFNLSVYRKLQDPNTKLPGGELLNKVKKTPEQIEKLRIENRAWNAYNSLRDKLEGLLEPGETWRERQDLQAVLKKAANTEIRQISEKWWKDWNDPERGDKSFRYARGLYEIVTDENFMSRYGNTKFWDDVKEFMNYRIVATTVRDALPAGDRRKSEIRNAYNALIESEAPKWHPKLRELIRRNFENDTLKAVN